MGPIAAEGFVFLGPLCSVVFLWPLADYCCMFGTRREPLTEGTPACPSRWIVDHCGCMIDRTFSACEAISWQCFVCWRRPSCMDNGIGVRYMEFYIDVFPWKFPWNVILHNVFTQCFLLRVMQGMMSYSNHGHSVNVLGTVTSVGGFVSVVRRCSSCILLLYAIYIL